MSRQFFINLPVNDVEATTAFYAGLGFEFNPAFSGPDAACMVINDSSFAMLLSRSRFADFTEGKPIADPTAATGVLFALSADSREDVDRTVAAAIAAGGTRHGEPQDHGFMYADAFTDLDGHGFQIMWMDPQAAADGPPDMAASA